MLKDLALDHEHESPFRIKASLVDELAAEFRSAFLIRRFVSIVGKNGAATICEERRRADWDPFLVA
jgi:hypothetical protein